MTSDFVRRLCVPKFSPRSWVVPAGALFLLVFSGCDRRELRALQAENQELKAELQSLRSRMSENAASQASKTTDLDLTLTQLWNQRFEDNQFRAKQRLDQKQIRVTGKIDTVTDRSVTLFETGTRFGSTTLAAVLDEDFLRQNMDILASLQKGATVTLQGRFVFDKMRLDGAVFIDRKSGKPLSAKELLNSEAESASVVEPASNEPQPPK